MQLYILQLHTDALVHCTASAVLCAPNCKSNLKSPNTLANLTVYTLGLL